MKIAIIEDHKIIAEALQGSLKIHQHIKEVRIFFSGEEILNGASIWKPNLIISDLLMPGLQGIELIKAYRAKIDKDLKIIILSSVTSKETVKQVLKQNVNGYLSKTESLDELMTAINSVIEGGHYISSSLKNILANDPIDENEIRYHLSPREKDVLRLVCSGRIIKEAAEDLNLSTHTVQSYHKNILRKFNVKRTTDLVRLAIQYGFYNPDEPTK